MSFTITGTGKGAAAASNFIENADVEKARCGDALTKDDVELAKFVAGEIAEREADANRHMQLTAFGHRNADGTGSFGVSVQYANEPAVANDVAAASTEATAG